MKVALLTVSDRASRGERADASGPALRAAVEARGGRGGGARGGAPPAGGGGGGGGGPGRGAAVVARGDDGGAAEVVPDEREAVAAALRSLGGRADLVLTTGGTGLSPRDRTPEATRDVVEREIPGFPEEIRRRSAARDPRGLLSRAVAGILPGGALVLNLPGSPGGAVECYGFVADALSHAVQVARGRQGDCGGGFSGKDG